MTDPMQLLLVGKLRPERKRSLTGMAVAADLQAVSIEESAQALVWLDSHAPGCVLVDAGAGRLDKLVGKLRADPKLSHVPVFALVSAPDDLWLEQYFGWGGDDVVHVDAGSTLLERLRAVPREPPPTCVGRRVAIADPDQSRIESMGRAFRLAGFEVSAALDRTALEATLREQRPAVVVANSVLGELPELIARARNHGSTAAFVVLAARRDLESQQQALGSIERCAVLGAQVNPWQVLYRANQLARPHANELRSEPRRAFGSFVLFRPAGSDEDDVGIAYNLSSRGMFVRTFAPVLADDVWLEWRVPQDATRVRIEGRVSFRQTSYTATSRAACPMGFGVEFRDYLGGARKHLDRALELLDNAALKSASTRPSAMPSGNAEAAASTSVNSPPIASNGAGNGQAGGEPPKANDPNAVSAASPSKPPAGRPLSLTPTIEKLAQPRPLSFGPNSSIKPLSSVIPTMLGATAVNESTTAKIVSTESDSPPAQPASKQTETASVDAKRPRVPPRPAGTPPAVAPTVAIAPPPTGTTAPKLASVFPPAAGLSDANVDVQVRRFDTLRDALPLDDLPENTDPVADRQLLDDVPTSSEPTEIRVGSNAMLDPDGSAFTARDELPRAADPGGATPDVDAKHRGLGLIGAAATRHDTEPSSQHVVEALYGAEEQVTRQWTAAGANEQSASGVSTAAKSRRWGTILGSLFAIGIGLGVAGYLLRTSLVTSPSSAADGQPSPVVAKQDARVPGQGPLANHAIKPGTEATPSASSTPSGSEAQVGDPTNNASDAGAIPWAKPDDGAPREGFPSIEDPYGGKGRLLADRYGYLVVRFPEAAFIYSKNIAMGATNWKIATECGEKTLRIGLGEKPTLWLSDEARVNVACRGTTNVLFERLPDVVVPPGVKRPIAPGSMPARKLPETTADAPSSTSGDADSVAPDQAEPTKRAPAKLREGNDNGSD